MGEKSGKNISTNGTIIQVKWMKSTWRTLTQGGTTRIYRMPRSGMSSTTLQQRSFRQEQMHGWRKGYAKRFGIKRNYQGSGSGPSLYPYTRQRTDCNVQ